MGKHHFVYNLSHNSFTARVRLNSSNRSLHLMAPRNFPAVMSIDQLFMACLDAWKLFVKVNISDALYTLLECDWDFPDWFTDRLIPLCRTSLWLNWTIKTWIKMSLTLPLLSGEFLCQLLSQYSLLIVCIVIFLLINSPFSVFPADGLAQLKTWLFISGTIWWRCFHPTCSTRLRFMRQTRTLLYIGENRHPSVDNLISWICRSAINVDLFNVIVGLLMIAE